MMPTMTVSNTFQTQSGSIPLSQLDGNFTDVLNYINSTYTPFITSTVIPSFGATQAQAETATTTASFLTPANVVFSPFTAKAWGSFSGTATGTTTFTSANSAGVATVERTGTGSYSIVFSRAFSSGAYALGGAVNGGAILQPISQGTLTATIIIRSTSDSPSDNTVVNFWAFGDLA